MRINDKQTESGRYYPVQVVILKIVAFILKQYAEDGKSTYELIIALKEMKGSIMQNTSYSAVCLRALKCVSMTNK